MAASRPAESPRCAEIWSAPSLPPAMNACTGLLEKLWSATISK